MSDLISRSALYDKLIYDTTKTATVTGGEYIATWRIADVIADAPIIDAVPVDKMELQQFSIDAQTRTAKAVFRFGDKRITLCRDCGELAPVVHGRWIAKYHKYYNRDGEWMIADEWNCSECGVRHRERWNYCPNCGAKMDLEAGHEP